MASDVKELVQQEMDLKILKTLRGGSGDICEGKGFETDKGSIFVKIHTELGAKLMFDGEYTSLKTIRSTGIVRVPEPLKVIENPKGGALLVMEYIDMASGLSKYSQELGKQLARLHLKNGIDMEQLKQQEGNIKKNEDKACMYKFGFDVPTCCGSIPVDNTWDDNWVTHYAKRIETHIKLVEEHYGDRQVRELWSQLLPNLHKLFEGLDIKPALLHGDLWGGNTGETEKEPVIFDPASFYGHSEFDLAIAHMFGGFSTDFFDSYHSLIPQEPRFETRLNLYKFFHYINHWNLFGTGYKSSTLRTLKSVISSLSK